MGADGAGCHLHQYSAGGHLYESAGLFRPADVHREDPVTAHFGRGDRVFAQSAGQFCGLPPRAAPAKEAQGLLEMKINKLKQVIADAKIIDESKLKTDSVQILNKVELKNVKNGMKMTYTIVSESEANLKEGKISVNTPIAQGLLGKKVGDVAEIKVPQGIINLEVVNISF